MLLFGGALLIALGAGLVAAHVTAFALDETLIEQSAVHYTHDFPHSLFHDLDARATNRLYSLVLSVAFRLFDGYAAVRVDHVLSAFLFVSAAFPIYLVARAVLRSRWAAVGVALLSVGVPWLTLTSALYTENLSYPLFWWMVLAVCGAVWRPSIARDALALLSILLLICTRVQFAAVFPGYVCALAVAGIMRMPGDRGLPRRLAQATSRALRASPLTAVALTAIVAGFVYERTSSHWQVEVEKLLGSYSNVVIRNGFSSNVVEGMLVELIALALGIGLLPAIISLAWYAKRMARPRMDRTWIFLCTSGIVLLFFLALTVFSQGGYLGSGTEERYFFYVIPVFWLGTFAAFGEGAVRPGEILACAAGLAALYGAIPLISPLTQETAFLAPAESVVPHILVQRLNQFGLTGLTVQDTLALMALVAGVFAACVWRRRAIVRMWVIVVVAVAVQLLITAYSFAVITGHVTGIVGRTAGGAIAPLGWVDTHARSGNVDWLDNFMLAVSESEQRTTLFWNSRITGWATLPALGLPPAESPLAALPGVYLQASPSTGILEPLAVADTLKEVVGAANSPFLQLAGSVLARSPDTALTLTQLAKPVQATWLATGLQADGAIVAGAPVHLAANAQVRAGARAMRIEFSLAPVPALHAGTSVTIRFGNTSRLIRLIGGSSVRHIAVTACFAPGEHALRGLIVPTHPLSLRGRPIAAFLESVRVAALANGGLHCPH